MIFVSQPIVNAMFTGNIYPATKDFVHDLVCHRGLAHTSMGHILNDFTTYIGDICNDSTAGVKLHNFMIFIDCNDSKPDSGYPTLLRLTVTTEFIFDNGKVAVVPGILCEIQPPYDCVSGKYCGELIDNINDYISSIVDAVCRDGWSKQQPILVSYS